MMICGKSSNSICLLGWNFVHEKGENICKKCLTRFERYDKVNRLSQRDDRQTTLITKQ